MNPIERSSDSSVFARIDALDVITIAFFVFAILAIWTEVQPFTDLQNYAAIDDATQSNTARKFITVGLVFGAVALVMLRGQLTALLKSISLPLVLVVIWFAATSVISPATGLALNRLALGFSVIAIAAALPLTLRRVDQFALVLALAASAIIISSIVSVAFAPEVAVHTAKDVSEQTLAGDWRGVFAHKNKLAAICAVMVIIGLFVARALNMAWGTAIVVAALFLMVMSGGKSAMLLTVPSMVVAFFVVRLRGSVPSFAAAFGLIGFMLLVTIGSTAFTWVQGFTNAIMPDASFTGRTEIWQLAMDAIGQRPVTGYGYYVFWDTNIVYGAAESGASAARASHAHNGYLETALAGGVPGLVLVLIWAAIQPWRHIRKLRTRLASNVERAFLDFLSQTWLFGLLISCLEAVLFNRADPTWFTTLLAIFCLQQWERAQRLAQ